MKPGKYIVAVSGGVDSMVLLDLLAKLPGIELVVAHFNHGIRDDSDEDESLVVETAGRYGLPYAIGRGKMGPTTSEEQARKARYAFLEEVRQDFEAQAVVTAHHQDDIIETAYINLLRGTGPQGLVALSDRKALKRPLNRFSKREIMSYAKANNLNWREDISNQDTSYLRNYVRKNVMSKMSAEQRRAQLKLLDKVAKSRSKQKQIFATLSQLNRKEIDRMLFTMLPAEVGAELLAEWLRGNGFRDFNQKTINRLNTAIRTAPANSRADVGKSLILVFDKQTAHLANR